MNQGYTKEYHSIRELLFRLPKKPTTTQYAILRAISRLTIGWSKPEGDNISCSQIAEECFSTRETVSRNLVLFHRFGIITLTKRGRGRVNHIRLNLDTCDVKSQPPVITDHSPCVVGSHTKEILKDNLKKKREVEATDNARASNREKTDSQNDKVFGKILRFPLSFLEIESENQEKVDA